MKLRIILNSSITGIILKEVSNDGFLLGRFKPGFDYKPYKNIHLSLGCINSSGKSFRKEELP